MPQPLTPLQMAELEHHRDADAERRAAVQNDLDFDLDRRSYLLDRIGQLPRKFVLACALVAALGVGSFMGSVGAAWVARSRDNHELAQSLRTAIPVVRALDIDVDPGRYTGKLLDVVLDVTRGGVYRSGKALYLQEREQGLALVIFQSAWAGFLTDGEKPDAIVSRYVGKTVKARGTVRSFGTPAGGESQRMSLIISAPGLLQELPQK